MSRILVIDDEPQVLKMLRKLLEPEGYTVSTASNGAEGVRQFQREPTDLVITDLIMPEKEGIETIRELKKQKPEVKIIAISGGGRNRPEGYLHTARLLGADEVFPKPVRKEAMLQAIHKLI